MFFFFFDFCEFWERPLRTHLCGKRISSLSIKLGSVFWIHLLKRNVWLTLAERVMKIPRCTGITGKPLKSSSTSALSSIYVAVTAQHSCTVALAC